jgi:beta-glucuronidase
MNSGNSEEAVRQFEHIIKEYPWAQAWDPRGWFWSVAEKSQASIDVLTGKAEEDFVQKTEKVKLILPRIQQKGTSKIVDYSKYGEFQNVGTEKYFYRMHDPDGLSAAIGEGIYPNTGAIYDNPRYKVVKEEGRLEGSHWDFIRTHDLEAAYFKWVTAKEPWGVRLFYLGMIFEKAGMYHEAIRSYHAIVVHFPKTTASTYWQTPWYPGQAAIAKIHHIIRTHPEIGLDTKWMKVTVRNGYDNSVENDVFVVHPGKILQQGVIDKVKDTLQLEKKVELKAVQKNIGTGMVRLVQYDNGHWQLLVNDQPYIIHGITYAPTKIGQSPDKGTLVNWMEEDSNGNGLADGPFDSWVDANRNDTQDPDEPAVGDFQLMKDMGANTLRIYQHPDKMNKELLRKMYHKYGFRVIIGDFLGKYAIGSGASWSEGTDYTNPEHRKSMLESVQKMVMEHKDEPYTLMWLLGNENNYGVACNADKNPQAYYTFVDEVAQWIKSVDPNHPVAINNGDTLYLDVFARYSPNVDIYAANVYRGDYGFGSYWEQVFEATGKPALITEYGSPAYAQHLTYEEAEQAQADYHRGNWLDIQENLADNARGVGNALGGVVFEWMDEWWKNYEPFFHDRKSDAIGPFPGGYYFEEWFGITGQGKGQHSPFERQLRQSYFVYKEFWKK